MVAEPKPRAWGNRIVRHGEVDPGELMPNPLNWRQHGDTQAGQLTALLDKVGWVQDVIVNVQTGNIVDGHLRVASALKRGEPTVPVVYVDLTAAEEALVLATLDPLGALATPAQDLYDALSRQAAIMNDIGGGPLAALLGATRTVDWSGAAPATPTTASINKAAQSLAAQFAGARGEGQVQLQCPDCGSTFFVDSADIGRISDGDN